MLTAQDITIRDPFVFCEDGAYYLFGSTDFRGWASKSETFSCYRSTDLINFEAPVVAFRTPEGFWADQDYWAPEVHKYRGSYYLIASFKAEGKCRAVHIMRANQVQGPYLPVSDTPITPADWECLDGTLYLQDGKPYLIFCHEWLQVKDGEMCILPLSDDLTHALDAPQLLFHASDCPATHSAEPKENYVTDGPFLYTMQDGSLIMTWSSSTDSGYAVLQARSFHGIFGPWEHAAQPLYSKDGGHGMVFRSNEGQLYFTLHAPNTTPLERPHFYPIREENGWLAIDE